MRWKPSSPEREKVAKKATPKSPVIPAMRAALCLCSRWLPLSSDYSHYGRTRVTRPPFSPPPPLREGGMTKWGREGVPEIVRKQSALCSRCCNGGIGAFPFCVLGTLPFFCCTHFSFFLYEFIYSPTRTKCAGCVNEWTLVWDTVNTNCGIWCMLERKFCASCSFARLSRSGTMTGNFGRPWCSDVKIEYVSLFFTV